MQTVCLLLNELRSEHGKLSLPLHPKDWDPTPHMNGQDRGAGVELGLGLSLSKINLKKNLQNSVKVCLHSLPSVTNERF